jgi:hypothetical protein
VTSLLARCSEIIRYDCGEEQFVTFSQALFVGDNCAATAQTVLVLIDDATRMGADEHVHERAFDNAQAKSIAKHEAQTLIG